MEVYSIVNIVEGSVSSQRCHCIGLSDGETMECLWSYLCWFNLTTEEMRSSHVLTNALTYSVL